MFHGGVSTHSFIEYLSENPQRGLCRIFATPDPIFRRNDGKITTFCASALNYVLEHGLENLTEENLMEMLTFANAAASLITTRKGALRVMPTRQEVLDFIAASGR